MENYVPPISLKNKVAVLRSFASDLPDREPFYQNMEDHNTLSKFSYKYAGLGLLPGLQGNNLIDESQKENLTKALREEDFSGIEKGMEGFYGHVIDVVKQGGKEDIEEQLKQNPKYALDENALWLTNVSRLLDFMAEDGTYGYDKQVNQAEMEQLVNEADENRGLTFVFRMSPKFEERFVEPGNMYDEYQGYEDMTVEQYNIDERMKDVDFFDESYFRDVFKNQVKRYTVHMFTHQAEELKSNWPERVKELEDHGFYRNIIKTSRNDFMQGVGSREHLYNLKQGNEMKAEGWFNKLLNTLGSETLVVDPNYIDVNPDVKAVLTGNIDVSQSTEPAVKNIFASYKTPLQELIQSITHVGDQSMYNHAMVKSYFPNEIFQDKLRAIIDVTRGHGFDNKRTIFATTLAGLISDMSEITEQPLRYFDYMVRLSKRGQYAQMQHFINLDDQVASEATKLLPFAHVDDPTGAFDNLRKYVYQAGLQPGDGDDYKATYPQIQLKLFHAYAHEHKWRQEMNKSFQKIIDNGIDTEDGIESLTDVDKRRIEVQKTYPQLKKVKPFKPFNQFQEGFVGRDNFFDYVESVMKHAFEQNTESQKKADVEEEKKEKEQASFAGSNDVDPAQLLLDSLGDLGTAKIKEKREGRKKVQEESVAQIMFRSRSNQNKREEERRTNPDKFNKRRKKDETPLEFKRPKNYVPGPPSMTRGESVVLSSSRRSGSDSSGSANQQRNQKSKEPWTGPSVGIMLSEEGEAFSTRMAEQQRTASQTVVSKPVMDEEQKRQVPISQASASSSVPALSLNKILAAVENGDDLQEILDSERAKRDSSMASTGSKSGMFSVILQSFFQQQEKDTDPKREWSSLKLDAAKAAAKSLLVEGSTQFQVLQALKDDTAAKRMPENPAQAKQLIMELMEQNKERMSLVRQNMVDRNKSPVPSQTAQSQPSQIFNVTRVTYADYKPSNDPINDKPKQAPEQEEEKKRSAKEKADDAAKKMPPPPPRKPSVSTQQEESKQPTQPKKNVPKPQVTEMIDTTSKPKTTTTTKVTPPTAQPLNPQTINKQFEKLTISDQQVKPTTVFQAGGANQASLNANPTVQKQAQLIDSLSQSDPIKGSEMLKAIKEQMDLINKQNLESALSRAEQTKQTLLQTSVDFTPDVAAVSMKIKQATDSVNAQESLKKSYQVATARLEDLVSQKKALQSQNKVWQSKIRLKYTQNTDLFGLMDPNLDSLFGMDHEAQLLRLKDFTQRAQENIARDEKILNKYKNIYEESYLANQRSKSLYNTNTFNAEQIVREINTVLPADGQMDYTVFRGLGDAEKIAAIRKGFTQAAITLDNQTKRLNEMRELGVEGVTLGQKQEKIMLEYLQMKRALKEEAKAKKVPFPASINTDSNAGVNVQNEISTIVQFRENMYQQTKDKEEQVVHAKVILQGLQSQLQKTVSIRHDVKTLMSQLKYAFKQAHLEVPRSVKEASKMDVDELADSRVQQLVHRAVHDATAVANENSANRVLYKEQFALANQAIANIRSADTKFQNMQQAMMQARLQLNGRIEDLKKIETSFGPVRDLPLMTEGDVMSSIFLSQLVKEVESIENSLSFKKDTMNNITMELGIKLEQLKNTLKSDKSGEDDVRKKIQEIQSVIRSADYDGKAIPENVTNVDEVEEEIQKLARISEKKRTLLQTLYQYSTALDRQVVEHKSAIQEAEREERRNEQKYAEQRTYRDRLLAINQMNTDRERTLRELDHDINNQQNQIRSGVRVQMLRADPEMQQIAAEFFRDKQAFLRANLANYSNDVQDWLREYVNGAPHDSRRNLFIKAETIRRLGTQVPLIQDLSTALADRAQKLLDLNEQYIFGLVTRPTSFFNAQGNANIKTKLEEGMINDLAISKDLQQQVNRMSILADKFIQVHDTVLIQEAVSSDNRQTLAGQFASTLPNSIGSDYRDLLGELQREREYIRVDDSAPVTQQSLNRFVQWGEQVFAPRLHQIHSKINQVSDGNQYSRIVQKMNSISMDLARRVTQANIADGNLRNAIADGTDLNTNIRQLATSFKDSVINYGAQLFKGVGNMQASQNAVDFLAQNLQQNNFFTALQADDLQQLARESVDLVARVMREDVAQAIAGKVAPNVQEILEQMDERTFASLVKAAQSKGGFEYFQAHNTIDSNRRYFGTFAEIKRKYLLDVPGLIDTAADLEIKFMEKLNLDRMYTREDLVTSKEEMNRKMAINTARIFGNDDAPVALQGMLGKRNVASLYDTGTVATSFKATEAAIRQQTNDQLQTTKQHLDQLRKSLENSDLRTVVDFTDPNQLQEISDAMAMQRAVIVRDILPTQGPVFTNFVNKPYAEWNAQDQLTFQIELARGAMGVFSMIASPSMMDMNNVIPVKRDQVVNMIAANKLIEDALEVVQNRNPVLTHMPPLVQQEFLKVKNQLNEQRAVQKLPHIFAGEIADRHMYNQNYNEGQVYMVHQLDDLIVQQESRNQQFGQINNIKQGIANQFENAMAEKMRQLGLMEFQMKSNADAQLRQISQQAQMLRQNSVHPNAYHRNAMNPGMASQGLMSMRQFMINRGAGAETQTGGENIDRPLGPPQSTQNETDESLKIQKKAMDELKKMGRISRQDLAFASRLIVEGGRLAIIDEKSGQKRQLSDQEKLRAGRILLLIMTALLSIAMQDASEEKRQQIINTTKQELQENDGSKVVRMINAVASRI